MLKKSMRVGSSTEMRKRGATNQSNKARKTQNMRRIMYIHSYSNENRAHKEQSIARGKTYSWIQDSSTRRSRLCSRMGPCQTHPILRDNPFLCLSVRVHHRVRRTTAKVLSWFYLLAATNRFCLALSLCEKQFGGGKVREEKRS